MRGLSSFYHVVRVPQFEIPTHWQVQDLPGLTGPDVDGLSLGGSDGGSESGSETKQGHGGSVESLQQELDSDCSVARDAAEKQQHEWTDNSARSHKSHFPHYALTLYFCRGKPLVLKSSPQLSSGQPQSAKTKSGPPSIIASGKGSLQVTTASGDVHWSPTSLSPPSAIPLCPSKRCNSDQIPTEASEDAFLTQRERSLSDTPPVLKSSPQQSSGQRQSAKTKSGPPPIIAFEKGSLKVTTAPGAVVHWEIERTENFETPAQATSVLSRWWESSELAARKRGTISNAPLESDVPPGGAASRDGPPRMAVRLLHPDPLRAMMPDPLKDAAIRTEKAPVSLTCKVAAATPKGTDEVWKLNKAGEATAIMKCIAKVGDQLLSDKEAVVDLRPFTKEESIDGPVVILPNGVEALDTLDRIFFTDTSTVKDEKITCRTWNGKKSIENSSAEILEMIRREARMMGFYGEDPRLGKVDFVLSGRESVLPNSLCLFLRGRLIRDEKTKTVFTLELMAVDKEGNFKLLAMDEPSFVAKAGNPHRSERKIRGIKKRLVKKRRRLLGVKSSKSPKLVKRVKSKIAKSAKAGSKRSSRHLR